MRKDEYDKIVNGVERSSYCHQALAFELIGGPLDGSMGTRYSFGIVIFGVLTIKLDDGQSLCGSMEMPAYFRSPFYRNVLIYKYQDNMRYEFEGWE